MPENTTPFQTWAIVELLGHKQLAGLVSEQAIAGTNLVRIDVPATPADEHHGTTYAATEGYTKLVGAGAIYAITPCPEEVARRAAREVERYNFAPFLIETRARPQRAIAAVSSIASDATDATWDGEEEDDGRAF